MMIYSRNDPVMRLNFPSSLKGATSDWFYSLPSHSLHNFSEVTEAFLIQYASGQEAKRNIYHLLFVKLRKGDSLKSYINLFQSQLAKVSNCNEEVFTSRSSVGCQSLIPCTNIS